MMAKQVDKMPYPVSEVDDEIAFDFIEEEDPTFMISQEVITTEEIFSQDISPSNLTKMSPVLSKGQP